MRILSWNINGIRTLPQYHPWNTLKTGDAILNQLNADIVCFQEMKITRSSLPRTLAFPNTYDSFFSFPTNKGGYSGVAVYTHSEHARPLKAEEGITGSIHPPALKPPWNSDEERISRVYPRAYDIELFPDEEGNTPADLASLDNEGRALTLDFGMFVLINTYCPNETSDARLPFKMNYHLTLQARVAQLIADGREVIVLGDINICAHPLDHCDGHLESVREKFWEHPAKKWFKAWCGEGGVLLDVVRSFWPERKGMYTCWNTRISARESNYGARVDYILVTPGLLPWIKHGDILPSLKGSDHCPIYIDLHDEIYVGEGEGTKIKLVDVMGQGRSDDSEPPRLAARYWEEYSGKQTLLSTFFGKGDKKKIADGHSFMTVESEIGFNPSQSQSQDQTITDLNSAEVELSQASTAPPEFSPPPPSIPTQLPQLTSITTGSTSLPPSQSQSQPQKRKQPHEPPMTKSSKKQKKKGQMKLSAFFSQPASPAVSTSNSADNVLSGSSSVTNPQDQDQVDSDYRLALQLSGSASQELLRSNEVDGAQPTPFFSSSNNSNNTETTPLDQQNSGNGKTATTAWSHLLAPIQPPKCIVHNEPAKELTVTKPGPNKGKNFFICSRPVGPGYDRGKTERLREEVDHRYKCNFFKWSSEVKRASMKEGR